MAQNLPVIDCLKSVALNLSSTDCINMAPLGSMDRRQFLFTAAMLPLGAAAAANTSKRPNFLIILADDQGWGDLSVSGNTNLATPNIDSLARDGAKFDRFFVCPVCAPTRAEFLTGRYHPRTGVRGVTTGDERMNLDESTIAQAFVQQGYATGAFGKWHNGSQAPYHPNSRGFQEFYGYTAGHWAHYFSPELEHNGRPVRGNGFLADDLTDHAISFIESNKSKPFLCYLPLNTPHSPMQVPDRFYRKFADWQPGLRATEPAREDLAHTRAALAMCENIDWNVGRVLAALDRLKLAEDTVVLYFSDNGPNAARWNGGMRGIKGTVDEGGTRVPCLVRWKGRIAPGSVIPQIAGAIDLAPTFAELAGFTFQPASQKPLDGRSLVPLLLSKPKRDWPDDRMIFSHQAGRVSVRTQQFRLDAQGRLYDMMQDPGQTTDVAAKFPDQAARLKDAVAAWSREVLPKGPDTRPFPAGFATFTMLPARDGVPHGKLKRSSRHPNSSYFMEWKSTEDYVTWDIEVGEAGEYEAVVYHAAAAPGAILELSFAGQSVSAPIAKAHNPPLIGAAEDRFPRTESYTKNFAPLRLGRIRLDKIRGPLTLRASAIPDGGPPEISMITLERRPAK